MINPEFAAAPMGPEMAMNAMAAQADVQTGRLANLANRARMTAAIAVAAGVALVGCTDGGSEGSSTTELDRGTGVEANVECGDPLELDDYKVEIEKRASSPITELKKGNEGDVDKIKAEIANELGRNNYLLAAVDTLRRYNDQPVNFEDIEGNIATTLQAIEKDEDKRDEICETNIGAFLTDGEKVAPESFAYLEAVPQYKGDDLNTKSTPLEEADANGKVEGFWLKRKDGTLPVVLTREGRLLISMTVGNENGDSSFDPNAEPQTFIDAEGNEVTIKPKKDGTVDLETRDPNTGETTTVTVPAGGGTNANQPNGEGPNGEGDRCGEPGQSDCEGPAGGVNPVNPAPGPGPGPAPGPGPGPNPTPTQPTPTTPAPTTTVRPTTTTTVRPTTTTTVRPTTTTAPPPPTTKPPLNCDPNIDDC